MSLSLCIGHETELMKRYKEIISSQYALSEKALLEYTKEMIRVERESTPVPENKRQLMDKICPQLKLICLGDMSKLMRELKS